MWWDAADIWLFWAFNDSLKESHSWSVFWAIANNRSFDIVPALFFAGLFIAYIRRGRSVYNSRVVERACLCLLAAIFVLTVTQAGWLPLEERRLSPTLVQEDPVRISEQVEWIKTKDKSNNSFPSDHGMVASMFGLLLIYLAGRRYALYAGLGIVISVLPRLVSGAHWLSDVVVGSLMFSLPAFALMTATPYFVRAAELVAQQVRIRVPWAETALLSLTDRERFMLAMKGVCMGTADIIPGVSGGTMAYILGIYEKILHTITRLNKSWLSRILRLDLRGALQDIPLLFIFPLLMGITLAIIIFTRLVPIPYLLTVYPEPVYGLFFGLIVGSIILLFVKHARARVSDILLMAIGCAVSFVLVSMIPADTPDEPWFIFICGSITILAMLLPGVSGSFLLLILGKYALVLEALGELDMTLLLPFASGCLVGLLCFSHALHHLLQRYHLMCMMVIIGLLAGSLRAVWPFQHRLFEEIRGKEILISSAPQWPPLEAPLVIPAIMIAIGLCAVFTLHWLAAKKTDV